MATLWLTQEQLEQAVAFVEGQTTFLDVVWIPVQPLRDTHTYIGIWPTLPVYNSFQIRFRRFIRQEETITLDNGSNIQLAETTGWELDSPVQVVPEWLARMMQAINS
jgi:hypothetical protein